MRNVRMTPPLSDDDEDNDMVTEMQRRKKKRGTIKFWRGRDFLRSRLSFSPKLDLPPRPPCDFTTSHRAYIIKSRRRRWQDNIL